MNFEEFKRRYIAKLTNLGFPVDEENKELNDEISMLYMALVVYNEFQHEQIAEQMNKQQRERKLKIHVPGGLH